jgi:hypothetical protein
MPQSCDYLGITSFQFAFPGVLAALRKPLACTKRPDSPATGPVSHQCFTPDLFLRRISPAPRPIHCRSPELTPNKKPTTKVTDASRCGWPNSHGIWMYLATRPLEDWGKLFGDVLSGTAITPAGRHAPNQSREVARPPLTQRQGLPY